MKIPRASRGVFLGGAKGNRTPDLLDANETRYQLRYSPKTLRPYQPVPRQTELDNY